MHTRNKSSNATFDSIYNLNVLFSFPLNGPFSVTEVSWCLLLFLFRSLFCSGFQNWDHQIKHIYFSPLFQWVSQFHLRSNCASSLLQTHTHTHITVNRKEEVHTLLHVIFTHGCSQSIFKSNKQLSNQFAIFFWALLVTITHAGREFKSHLNKAITSKMTCVDSALAEPQGTEVLPLRSKETLRVKH